MMQRQPVFLDPTNDLAFRKLFGTQAHSEIIRSFLNCIVQWPDNSKAVSVQILNPYLETEPLGGKTGIVDVRCVDQEGREYLVEMQLQHKKGFKNRVLLYMANSFAQEISKGDEYADLKPKIYIGVLDFRFLDNPHYLACHRIMDETTGEVKLDYLTYYFVQLPNFHKTENELENDTDKWLFFLKHAEKYDAIPRPFNEPLFDVAFDLLRRLNMNIDEYNTYISMGISRADRLNEIALAVENALAQAEIDKENALAQAEIDKENALMQSKIETAREMKRQGLPADLIRSITGLEAEQYD